MPVLIVRAGESKARRVKVKFSHLVLAITIASVTLTGVLSTGLWVLQHHWSSSAQSDSVEQLASQQELSRRIGEMQARLSQLDALSTELAEKAGVNHEEIMSSLGQGGPLVAYREPSYQELSDHLLSLEAKLNAQDDLLKMVDGHLAYSSLQSGLTPHVLPVRQGYISSPFGQRVDPIRGGWALHNGQDFAAPRGTPIYAAAGGVVVESKYHSSYGNMIEIRHNDGLVTRYAHASSLLVQVGDLVKPGQQIATVGSTGRSTGTHLHFEVLSAGQAVDPAPYLGIEKILSQRPSVETLATQTP